ncbi:hypothetical protein [Noviherbaspirillum saxi]|uniref:hypothetical protein n=1 Tax=Noviherbaspirillum saxi TaxID=2320863 RepID=UPI0011C4AC68|nr:hypothetical protein [Noviherbaspirillum saxi]
MILDFLCCAGILRDMPANVIVQCNIRAQQKTRALFRERANPIQDMDGGDKLYKTTTNPLVVGMTAKFISIEGPLLGLQELGFASFFPRGPHQAVLAGFSTVDHSSSSWLISGLHRPAWNYPLSNCRNMDTQSSHSRSIAKRFAELLDFKQISATVICAFVQMH